MNHIPGGMSVSDSKKEPVTQADFSLFKQEMKHEFMSFKKDMKHEFMSFQDNMNGQFKLYLSQIDSKTAEVINKHVDKFKWWAVGIGSLFVIAFFTYFEVMRTKVDQLNSERIARVEEAYTFMNQYVMGVLQDQKKDKEQSDSPLSIKRKTKRLGK